MCENELKRQTENLSIEQQQFEKERLEFEQKKLQRLTIVISAVAVLVSFLQVWVAFLQSKLVAAQTMEKFIPYLQKTETKDIAILVMQEFSDRKLVMRLATAVKATEALQEIKNQGTPDQQQQAKVAIDKLAQQRTALIKRIFSSDKFDRIQATTVLYREWLSDSNVFSDVVLEATNQPDNKPGVINALFLISSFPTAILRANVVDIEPLLQRVERNGVQTAEYVKQIRQKMANTE